MVAIVDRVRAHSAQWSSRGSSFASALRSERSAASLGTDHVGTEAAFARVSSSIGRRWSPALQVAVGGIRVYMQVSVVRARRCASW